MNAIAPIDSHYFIISSQYIIIIQFILYVINNVIRNIIIEMYSVNYYGQDTVTICLLDTHFAILPTTPKSIILFYNLVLVLLLLLLHPIIVHIMVNGDSPSPLFFSIKFFNNINS